MARLSALSSSEKRSEPINIERTSDNIVQVLPNEVITSLPNTNIADAVGRLPSVSLSEMRAREVHPDSRHRAAPEQCDH